MGRFFNAKQSLPAPRFEPATFQPRLPIFDFDPVPLPEHLKLSIRKVSLVQINITNNGMFEFFLVFSATEEKYNYESTSCLFHQKAINLNSSPDTKNSRAFINGPKIH